MVAGKQKKNKRGRDLVVGRPENSGIAQGKPTTELLQRNRKYIDHRIRKFPGFKTDFTKIIGPLKKPSYAFVKNLREHKTKLQKLNEYQNVKNKILRDRREKVETKRDYNDLVTLFNQDPVRYFIKYKRYPIDDFDGFSPDENDVKPSFNAFIPSLTVLNKEAYESSNLREQILSRRDKRKAIRETGMIKDITENIITYI